MMIIGYVKSSSKERIPKNLRDKAMALLGTHHHGSGEDRAPLEGILSSAQPPHSEDDDRGDLLSVLDPKARASFTQMLTRLLQGPSGVSPKT